MQKNKKTKVLHIISTLRRCGPTNLMYDIVKHLPLNKFEPIILTLSSRDTNTRLSDFQKLPSVKIFCLEINNLKDLLFVKNRLNLFCKQHEIDVIHSHGLRPDIFTSSFLKKVDKVYNIPNYPFEDFMMQFGKIGWLYAYINLFCLRNEKKVTACSNYVKERIKKYINHDVQVIHNSTEFGFKSLGIERNSLKEKLDINDNDFVFLFAGDLSERKNAQLIIKAFIKLNKLHANTKLLILGDGPLKGECLNLSKGNDAIRMLGMVNNVSDYMQISHFYVSASKSEGMPLAVLEALNHGLGIILSDIPQHKEVFVGFEEIGICFKLNNENDLLEKMEWALNTDVATMSLKATESVEKYYNSKRLSGEFQKLYLN